MEEKCFHDLQKIKIKVDLRAFVNTSYSVFLKKDWNTYKIKTKFCLENPSHTFTENAMILTCAKIQRKTVMFGEVGAPESSFWDWKLHEY